MGFFPSRCVAFRILRTTRPVRGPRGADVSSGTSRGGGAGEETPRAMPRRPRRMCGKGRARPREPGWPRPRRAPVPERSLSRRARRRRRRRPGSGRTRERAGRRGIPSAGSSRPRAAPRRRRAAARAPRSGHRRRAPRAALRGTRQEERVSVSDPRGRVYARGLLRKCAGGLRSRTRVGLAAEAAALIPLKKSCGAKRRFFGSKRQADDLVGRRLARQELDVSRRETKRLGDHLEDLAVRAASFGRRLDRKLERAAVHAEDA